MKRSIDSSSNLKPLKRANSSLFSIATLVDDECNVDSVLPGGLTIEEKPAAANCKVRAVSSASELPLLDGVLDDEPPEEMASSCSDSESESSPDFAMEKLDQCREINEAAGSAAAASAESAKGLQSEDLRTGLVFESATNHYDRYNKLHKERPTRVTSVYDYLSNQKAQDGRQSIFERCQLKETGEVKSSSDEEMFLQDDDYLRVHLPGYMQRLDKISKCNCHNKLDIEAEQFKSIYLTNDSVHSAKKAASSLCKLVSDVVTDKLDNGFAVIRPPGHHAEPGEAGGYCVINNVAVAAAYARQKLCVNKILIVDWDVHHGNGTQRCFIDNPNVMYFSVHRYHGGNFFPFLQQGGPSSVGTGAGRGFNMNIGWNDKKMGDDEYLVVWEKILMPVAKEFNPDLVLVSAGFDAAAGDMGECDVTPECFGRLTRRLKTLAGGKIVCALEGGYVRSVLCNCIESVVASLLDAKSEEKCKEEVERFYENVGEMEMLDCIEPSAAKSIRATVNAHAEFWNCLTCSK